MTILHPNRNRPLIYFFGMLGVLLLSGGIAYIFAYNSLVNSRYAVGELKKQSLELQVRNSDLKDELYSMTDAPNLKEKAAEFGLTLEKRPEYLNEHQWLSDSSH